LCSNWEGAVLKNKSSWGFYGVKIIKQCIVEGEPDPSLIDEFYGEDDDVQHFEESILIIRAQSLEHAHKLAENKAIKDEEPYLNVYGEQVVWKFIAAVGCFEILGELKSGAEVYSRFHAAHKSESANEFIDRTLACYKINMK
jgi:hypothetical protein